MDSWQAKKIIKDTFENKFEKARFTKFIVELLNLSSEKVSQAYTPYNTYFIPNIYQPYINSFEKIATYETDGLVLDVLVIKLSKESSVERARTMQRNFIAWYLKGECDGDQKDAALAAFVSPDEHDWRFSLIKMDYSLTEDSQGKVKIIENFSPAKRWSFLVGANERSHTAQAQLLNIVSRDDEDITFGQLEEAFSVEKVTKEFFEKYRELFYRTNEALEELVKKDSKLKVEFEEKNIETSDFAKKLLGQIVFLYFLQKKGWFGAERDKDWGTGPKDFLRRLFDKKHRNYNNFFNDILEPLFYEALRIDRSHDDNYYSRLNCKIPFLNGGLFDPINNYDWVHTDIILPNELFSNKNFTKEGDSGDGILDIFDRYNFTVQEDEPLEKEVAVDPEMLGKVFENLLEVKDRKSKGTYYTPREIVHYMCQQSLINYLYSELEDKVGKKDIEVLIKYGENIGEDIDSVRKLYADLPNTIANNANLIDEKLIDVKICDPAVGSGAFLVGMMSEIVGVRNILTKYLNDPKRNNYSFKRDCIENSLYGVDIDSGAVEICKLRLWLSLIVDEEDIRNIKPLPNLDYKIMQGNSLVEMLSGEFLISSTNNEKRTIINKLQKSKNELFNISSPKLKEEKRHKINDLIRELFELNKSIIIDGLKRQVDLIKNQVRLFQDEKAEKNDLKKIKETQEKIFKYQKVQIPDAAEHFEWTINFSEVFQENDGFDIVIGNPPYIQLQKEGGKLANLYKGFNYKTFDSMGDIYCLFYEKGIQLLKENKFLCFITSNKWMRAGYGEKLRLFFLEHNPLILIDLGPGVFENATVDTNILLIQKDKNQKKLKASTYLKTNLSLSDYMNQNAVILNTQSKDAWFIGNDLEQRLKEKIERIGKPLKEWDVKIYRGILTGLNEAFIIDTPTKERLCREDPKSEEILKPILRGRDIKRYRYEWAGLWLIASGYDIDIPKKYPAIYRHLLKFEEKAKKRDDQGKNWWNLRSCTYYPEFGKEKIVWAGVGDKRFEMAILPAGMFLREPANLMTGENLKFFLGFIQSELVKFYYDKIKTEVGRGTRFYIRDFLIIPIPSFKSENSSLIEKIEKLVEKILKITKDEDYLENTLKQDKVKEYESQIDRLVYKLCDLTPEEIEIVENSIES